MRDIHAIHPPRQVLLGGACPAEQSGTMHYVLLAQHTAETCPMSNSKVREHLMKGGPEIPKLAAKLGVKILSGPLVSREHLSVVVVESGKAEAVDDFINQSGLALWNSVRVVPSKTMDEGMKELGESKPIW